MTIHQGSLASILKTSCASSFPDLDVPPADAKRRELFEFLTAQRMTTSAWRSMEFESAIVDIHELEGLADGWDGYGAARISQPVVKNSKAFLRILLGLPFDLPKPKATPTSHGTITISWENDYYEVVLDVGIDQYSGYFCNVGSPPKFLEGSVDSFKIEQGLEIAACMGYAVHETYLMSNIQVDRVGIPFRYAA